MRSGRMEIRDHRIYDLAKSLAGPVARGLLPGQMAEVALLIASVRAGRAGDLAHDDPIDVARFATHVMQLNVDQITAEQRTTAGRIRRALRPLIGIELPTFCIRAEAHEINDAADTPLRREAVEEIVNIELWRLQNPETESGPNGR